MRCFRFVVVFSALVLVAGCGSNKLATRVRVLKGGEPLKAGKGEFIRVVFVPVLPDGKRAEDYHLAEFDRDAGTFKAAGKDLKGIPPGKYRVAVMLDKKGRDLFNGKFGTETSPFVYDVDASTAEIVIDVDRPPAKQS